MQTTLRPTRRTYSHSLAHELHDLWHGEQLLAWKLDAWLLEHGASHGDRERNLAYGLRRSLRIAREALKREVLRAGLQLVRLPMVTSTSEETQPAANRQLRGIYAQLTRQQVRVRRLVSEAQRERDFGTTTVLRDVQDAHAEAIELFETLLLGREPREAQRLEFAA